MNLIPTPVYPDSDGKPMADNTKQANWIVLLFTNLRALFSDLVDVFVAADLFWYPVEGRPDLRTAPDVLVVFGRPKGDRGSYKQWEEGDVPVTVAFEILSPGNTYREMDDKQAFYEEHGVEEYYIYDPDANRLSVFRRQGEVLRRVRPADNFLSPRLGIRFDLRGEEMIVYGSDGTPFRTLEAETGLRREAQRQAETERQQRLDAERRAVRLVELGRKVRRGQATPDELAELERLEAEVGPSP